MGTKSNIRNNLSASQALPGTQSGSDIQSIYEYLASGQVLTSLDAVFSNRTVNLTKYISVLRNKYGITICDEWVKISKRKRVKKYYMKINS